MKTLTTVLTVLFLTISVYGYEVPAKEANLVLEKMKSHTNQEVKMARTEMAKGQVTPLLCAVDEAQYLEVEAEVVSKLHQYFSSMGETRTSLQKVLTSDFYSSDFPLKENKIEENYKEEGIEIFSLIKKSTKIDQKKFFTEQEKIFKNMSSMDFVSLDTAQILSHEKYRGKDQITINRARLVVNFDYRFRLKNKNRVNSRGVLNLFVKKETDGWKLSGLELVNGTNLVAQPGDRFQEITESSIAGQIPTHLRREAIRRGGYATAIGDYNNDGHLDVLAATAEEVVLLKGSKDGTFKAEDQKDLAKETFVKSAAFVDLTNSGQQDLVLVRFAFEKPVRTKDTISDIVIYKNVDGKFVKVDSPILYRNEHPYAMPLAIADFNKDGLIDMFVGFPGARDFTTMNERQLATMTEINSHGFFFNSGKAPKFFVEQDANQIWHKVNESKLNKSGDSMYYPHSAVAVDFNLDGRTDIVVVDDRSQISPIYQGTENSKFKKANEAINVATADYGMGVAFGDLFNEGQLDFVMSSVNFSAHQRINDSCQENWNILNTYSSGKQGLRLYKNEGKFFAEVAKPYGLTNVGYGVAGIEFIDYNNDGNLDILVSNGLWSGNKNTYETDISSVFARSSRLGLFEDELKDKKYQSRIFSEKTEMYRSQDDGSWFKQNNKSQSAVMDVLSFGKNKQGHHYGLAGYQRNRIFRNNGHGQFTEVGYGLGLDSEADGYMVGFADFNRDGRMDVIYRNADPGVSKNQFAPLQIFLNKMNNDNSVELKLAGNGQTSNRDAVGTIVKADLGNKRVLRQLIGMNGTIQSEKIVHFGLGSNESIKNIEIVWPDGSIQKIDKLKKGIYQINQNAEVRTLVQR